MFPFYRKNGLNKGIPKVKIDWEISFKINAYEKL